MKTAEPTRAARWRKDKPRFIAGRATRSREGLPYERTELLPRNEALLLAAALVKLDSIRSAQVRRDHHVTGSASRWYVRFVRIPLPEQTADQRRMADIRIERGVHQYREMEFLPCQEQPGWYHCLHFKPETDVAGVYLTHISEGCTCPDFQYRLTRTSVNDKHQVALRIHLHLPTLEEERAAHRRQLADLVQIFPENCTPEERRAALERAMRDDF